MLEWRRVYKDKALRVLKNSLHASAIIPECLSSVSKQTCEPVSPGILICSPNVLWQRNSSHLHTNKLDLTAHLHCKTCMQVWQVDHLQKAEEDRAEFFSVPTIQWSSWVQNNRSEGREKSCVWALWLKGLWWGPDCSWPVNLNQVVRNDSRDIELGEKIENSGGQCTKKTKTSKRTEMLWQYRVKAVKWRYEHCFRTLRLLHSITSLWTCPPFSSLLSMSWSSSLMILTIFDSQTFWLFKKIFFLHLAW